MNTIKSTLALAGKLRNAEHFDFYELIILKYGDGKTLRPAALQPLWTSFCQVFAREDDIYKRHLGQEITPLLDDAHKKRKNVYMKLKRTVEAASYDDTPALQAAAGELMRILDNYPRIPNAPLTEASAMIVNLVQDLVRPAHAAAMTLLGAAEIASRLSDDNKAFMTLYNERTLSEGEEKGEGSLAEARRQTDHEFNSLCLIIAALYQANEKQRPKDPEVTKVLSELILFLNAHIARYEAIYARRTPGGYHPGKGGEPSHPGAPDAPDAPEDLPQLAIAAQEILGQHPNMTNMGTQMSLAAADAGAFADALYPAAEGGVVRLTPADTESSEDPQDYPVAGFLLAEGTTPVGLIVNGPRAGTVFYKPFEGEGEAEGEVFRDGALIATLTGLQLPGYMTID